MQFNPTNYPLVTPVPADTLLLRQASSGRVRSALVSAVAQASAPIQVVNSIAELEAISVDGLSNNAPVIVSGYYEVADGGGGQFIYDISSSAVANGGTVIAPADGDGRWIREYSGPINVLWFGAVGDGTTDDTDAFQAAVTASAGNSLFIPDAIFAVSEEIALDSSTEYFGTGQASVIKLLDGDQNGFLASSKSSIFIHGIRFLSTNEGTTSGKAGVKLSSSNGCRVENCSFSGMSWSGVFLDSSSRNTVTSNLFEDAFGDLSDSNDICAYRNSNENEISFNYCQAGSWHGIFMQNPDVGTPDVCVKNVACYNQIKNCKAYGIVAYAATQSYNFGAIIHGNVISEIDGAVLSGVTGAGIYIAQAGGTVVTGNTISRCCISTTNFGTLAPGCIGVASVAGSWPIVIGHNALYSTRGPCIAAISNEAKLIIQGNACKLNNSTVSTNSKSITLVATSQALVDGNALDHTSTIYAALEVLAINGYTSRNVGLSNNTIDASAIGIDCAVAGSGNYVNLSILNNRLDNATDAGIRVSAASNSLISGNAFSSDLQVLVINSCPKLRLSGNAIYSASTAVAIEFNGVNTGSICDTSNNLDAKIGNFGTGMIVEKYGNAAPGSVDETWAVGDSVTQSVPVVGQPKGWRCTVAGAPGTWVSEGNL